MSTSGDAHPMILRNKAHQTMAERDTAAEDREIFVQSSAKDIIWINDDADEADVKTPNDDDPDYVDEHHLSK